MRIVLDLQGAQGGSRFRGIGRYTLSLARAIVRQRGEHEIILALSDLYPDTVEPIRGLFDGQLPQERIKVWQAPGPVRSQNPANEWRRAAAVRIREAFIASLEPDLVHVSDLFGGSADDVVSSVSATDARFQTTVTLYDLIPLLDPTSYLAPNPRFERHYHDALAQAKRADGWLAISESSAREARDHLGLDPGSVVNVSAACDPIFGRMAVSAETESRLRARFDLTRPYVMYSGGFDPRKNLDRLIRAYADLPSAVREAHQLVLVGKMHQRGVDAMSAMVLASGLRADDVRLTGYVEDDDLVLLYNLCELFVLPSLHEGFGLPALEAMACGAAVVGANVTSLPEVIGWPDAMFDPLDVAAMSAKIGRALTDEAFRAELIVRGNEQAQAFSWDESASRAIAAFERFHGRWTPGRAPRNAGPKDYTTGLVRQIRAAPGRPNDQDLISTARAIALNLPESSEPRLLLDVSRLLHVVPAAGVQRVALGILARLPSELPAPYRMEPVFATADGRTYRHAHQPDPGDATGPVISTDIVVDPRPRDVFLGLDVDPGVVAAQSGFYAELRRLGIPVYFVVYDLPPALVPRPSSVRDPEVAALKWLEVVSATDGALCVSGAVAEELRSWMTANGPVRHRPFRISVLHLGADVGLSDRKPGLPDTAGQLVSILFDEWSQVPGENPAPAHVTSGEEERSATPRRSAEAADARRPTSTAG